MVMQMSTRVYFPQAIKPIRFTLNKKIKELKTYTEKRKIYKENNYAGGMDVYTKHVPKGL